MKNYWDKYSRLHDKPVTEANPIPCNNSFIYTAYFAKLGGPVNEIALDSCYDDCLVTQKDGSFYLNRSPGKVTPPISRDEILGMASLDLLASYHLKGWIFSPYPIPAFSPLKLAQQLWQLRPSFGRVDGVSERLPRYELTFKHRNYFWQNGLDQIYLFAFSVPLVDRAFILEKWGKKNYFYSAIAYLDKKLGQASGLRFLKYGGKKNEEAMRTEFSGDHPLAKK